MRGIDVSNYSGTPTLDAVRAIVTSMHIEKITIACQFQKTYEAWRDIALALGIDYDSYLFLYNRGSTYWTDAPSFIGQIDRCTWLWPRVPLWLDIEDITGTLPSVRQVIDAGQYAESLGALSTTEGGIYSAKYVFDALGNPQLGRYWRLWDAEYDNNPMVGDVNYGGWIRPAAKQYAGTFTSYGLSFGLDVWE